MNFGDVQTQQSIRMQKAELPTLKYLLITQLSRYLEQRFLSYRDRQLESHSVMAIFILLEDLHTLIRLRDYKDSINELNHEEEFQKLKKECDFELTNYMGKKFGDVEKDRLLASQKLMGIFNKIFRLETRYLERFGLLEPQDTQYEASADTDVEVNVEEIKKELEEMIIDDNKGT